MQKNEKKSPFRDLANTLKEIKEKPLTEEKIERINSIIENNSEEFENAEPLKKIAMPNENMESYQ